MIIIMNTKWKKHEEKWVEDDFQKSNKKRQRRIKFNKSLSNFKLVGKCFVKGASAWICDPAALLTVGTVGLSQGFKYNGNLKRGLIAGGITAGVIGAIGGIATIQKNWELIKKGFKH